MDSEGGYDENLEADTCASNNRRVTFSPRIIFLNSDHGGGCQLDSETNRELKSPDSSDTESSSLSNSSFDDVIQINTQILLKSSGEKSISQPTVSTKPSNVKEKSIVTSEAFYRLKESINKYPESTSQSLDDTNESVRDYMLPTLSPSIQMMEWPENFDRHGTGASLSSRRSAPVDPSAASDDSLFRIHITKKKEDVLRTDVDLYKSEERPKTGELRQSGVEPNRKLDTVKFIGEDMNSREKGMVDESHHVSESPINNPFGKNVGDSRKKKYPRSLCHCPDFCLAFHCFKWPSCCSSKWIGWPGCSINCSWLGCCCKWSNCYCKCLIWSSCCVKRNY